MPFREESCRSSCIYSGPLHSHSRDTVSQHLSTRAGVESIQLIYSGRALQALSVSRENENQQKGSEKSVRIVVQAVRVLGCLTVRASRNSIFVEQCRLVLPSPLALPFFIALASLHAVASLLAVCLQIMPSAQIISCVLLPSRKGITKCWRWCGRSRGR